ncbi:hypothetical protein FHX52_2733 [Humibacillus xanthopallidus]|uniref:Muconolactone delta-isomerase n=1 Tax=Humibacillus xanthopallidus TaxID=412689 RepID=A0A543PPN0_9MICO|nr:hypothetical protein [Humibacillus xanthopallidus]TQN46028.1 hypothetical protein FHX52_2733 [Humibacillus xanthopallidus]
MKVLAISTNTGDTRAYLADEGARVEDLTRQGVVERVLLKADWSGAMLLLEVPDLETARATVKALPIAAHGLARFDLTPVVEPPAQGGSTSP